MSKSIDQYVGQEEQSRQQVEEVRSNMATHRGDPPPGISQADLNTAVREAQSQPQQSSVAAQQTQEKEGVNMDSSPGVAKQDLASKVGPETAEKQQSDASKAVADGLSPEAHADLSEFQDRFAGQVSGDGNHLNQTDLHQTVDQAQHERLGISQEVNGPSVEASTEQSAAMSQYVPEDQQRGSEREPEPEQQQEAEAEAEPDR